MREKERKLDILYEMMLSEWHEAISTNLYPPNFDFFEVKNQNPFKVMQRNLQFQTPSPDFVPELPSGLWQSPQMSNARKNLIGIYAMADSFFQNQPYNPPRLTNIGEKVREEQIMHGLRASYFALRYLGVIDPAIHALILLHDWRHFYDNLTDEGQRESLKEDLRKSGIDEQSLPQDFIDTLMGLEDDDNRCRKAASKVSGDDTIPKESELGAQHTAETFWRLYEHVAKHHTSEIRTEKEKFRGPLALYPDPEQINRSVPLSEYRQYIARLALAYEKYRHPKTEQSSKQIQQDALMVLMELWPIARGLDERRFSGFMGECIGMAFMPEAYKSLCECFPDDSTQAQQKKHAQIYNTFLKSLVGNNPKYISPYEQLKMEYLMLKDRQVKWGPFDVAVPGKITGNEPSDLTIIEIKKRASIFWKMLEIWNERKEGGKYSKLPANVKKMRWGTKDFWKWAIRNHHDIFRTQVFLLGDTNQWSLMDPDYIERIQSAVFDQTNKATCLFPDYREKEIFEIKEKGEAIWINALFDYGIGSNLEVQIGDRYAYVEKGIQPGSFHHAVYKMRHAANWINEGKNEEKIKEDKVKIAVGARKLRIAHLGITYGFDD